jgi:hypothetical protein
VKKVREHKKTKCPSISKRKKMINSRSKQNDNAPSKQSKGTNQRSTMKKKKDMIPSLQNPEILFEPINLFIS